MKLSDHFNSKEFACKCGCGLNSVSMDLVRLLEAVRESSSRPVNIVSGLRCEAHNAAVGGVAKSAHLRGTAADISVYGGEHRFAVVSSAIEAGAKGIGVAKTFIHIDVCNELPRPSLWGY